MRHLSPFLLAALLLLAMGVASAQGEQAEEETDQPVSSGHVILQADPPGPGDPVKVRLRDEALAFILSSPDGWSLRDGANEIPAGLVTSTGSKATQPFPMVVIDGGRLDSRDRQVVIDRGTDPVDIDYLQIEFSSTDVLTTVLPAAGPTREDFSQVGKEQPVLQRVSSEDGLLSITRIDFSPLPVNRYIRLTIRNASDHAVASVLGGRKPGSPDLHQVPVVLGSMRSLPAGGGSVWPLIMESNLIPLRKMKIVSESPGMLRRIRFVRLDENLREAERESEMVYADSLPAGAVTFTNNYMDLPGSSNPGQPALIVEDGMREVLPIKSVEAYAAEVYICFNWPENANPALSASSSESPAVDIPEEAARFIGSFEGIAAAQDQVSPTPEVDVEPSPGGSSSGFLSELDLGRFMPRFSPGFRTLLPAGIGLFLLGMVILLVSRGRASTE